MMSISECIRRSFTAGSALGLVTSTLRTPQGSTPGPQALQGGYSITACPNPAAAPVPRGTLLDHPNT